MVGVDKDLIDLVQSMPGYELIGVFDKHAAADALGAPHLGEDEGWLEFLAANPGVKILVSIDPPRIKAKLIGAYGRDNLAGVAAPSAYVSPHAKLGQGCIVQRSVSILPDVEAGMAVKFNVGAAVHHDCRIGDYCTLAPGARLLGAVELGEGVYLGSHAVVLQKRRVGAGAVIGAGAVVIADVPAGATVVGVPARPVDRRDRAAAS
jgi:sugar O-acyltransferase (sialic acid O-acetyltransferase NeuD family)